jgi:protein-S-isoprenylcysteine O-methyltransferase Ste14
MKSNRFFSATVRIQHERKHQVIAGGPYRYIRHPGYAGIIVFQIATPFLLGSLWALIPSGLSVVLFMLRTALEDKTLRDELSGYAEYAATVRRRLIPGVW